MPEQKPYVSVEENEGKTATLYHPPIEMEASKRIIGDMSREQLQKSEILATRDRAAIISVQYLIGPSEAYLDDSALMSNLCNRVALEGYSLDHFGVDEEKLRSFGKNAIVHSDNWNSL